MEGPTWFTHLAGDGFKYWPRIGTHIPKRETQRGLHSGAAFFKRISYSDGSVPCLSCPAWEPLAHLYVSVVLKYTF